MKTSRHILIDMQTMYTAHATRGIGTLVLNMVRSLVEIDKDNKYYLLNFYGNVPAKFKIGGGSNVVQLNYYEKVKEYLYENTDTKKKKFFDRLVQKILEDHQIDIVLLGTVVDYYNIYSCDCFKTVKLVTVAHDLIPLVFGKQYMSNAYTAFRHYQWYEQFLYSDFILSNSEYTKCDMIKYLEVDADRFAVIYGGTNPMFRKMEYPKEEKNRVFRKFDIYGKYLFYVGADDFRKNLDRLAKAFLDLPEELLEEYQLVITCDISQATKQRLTEYEKDRPVGKKRLVVTGFVTDDEMLLLLNNAKLAVFPSLYEGLGLPVIEAWKCGVPVLTSNNSSLGEIAQDVAVTVDPFSEADICRGLVYALTEADLSVLVQRGLEKSKEFTYENAAKVVLDSYDVIEAMDKVDTRSGGYRRKLKKLKKLCKKHVNVIGRWKYFR